MHFLKLVVCVSAAAAYVIRDAVSTAGVQALVQRRMPEHAASFEFQIVNAANSSQLDNDRYTVSSAKDGKILVQGNTVSALLSGLHTYLAGVLHVDIWWFIGSQLDQAPHHLPALSSPLTGSSVVPYRYFGNTVTTSYTSAFWTWEDWELMLDWMALRGVNLPLAWIGFEKILIEVFEEIGFSYSQIDDFISGPAFLAWNHMGNIQGSWGGAMPRSWVNDQFSLQMKIVRRMVELGMTPVLPGFSGYVPRSIAEVVPSANASNGSNWEGFPTEYTNVTFLDPLDSLFTELQAKIISKQKDYYGNITTFYAIDQFNENTPSSGALDYLESVSENTWKSIKAADPEGIWVMQGWLFSSQSSFWTNDRVKAFLGGVADDSDMLILDLFSESQPQWQRTSSFYGKPWVWCELHGYGGNNGLYGQIMNVTVNAVGAVHNSSSSVTGFGLTMEGLEGNEIMYGLLLDQAWKNSPIDTKSYFHDWVSARYGASHITLPSEIYSAWEILRPTVFNNTNLTANAVPKAIFELVPSNLGLTSRTGHHPTVLNYDPKTMVKAWGLLYQAGNENPNLFSNPAYHYDLVDWTRQVFSNAFIPMYEQLIETYTTADQTSRTNTSRTLSANGKELIAFLTSLDGVLSTNENFRLSTWIKTARATANKTDTNYGDIADFLEYEARNQVTLWGPTGQVTDYASKSWGGLVLTYYVPRWERFIDYLARTPVSSYNQTGFNQGLLEWELQWTSQTTGASELHDSTEDLQSVLKKVVREWDTVFEI